MSNTQNEQQEKQIEAFFNSLPEEKRSQFRQLDAFIRQHAPNLLPYSEGKFLGYGKYHYRYKSGREGDWFTVGLANNKNSIGVYVLCQKDGKYLLDLYSDKLPSRTGKSCINYKNFDKIDWQVLEAILKDASNLYKPLQIS